MNTATQSTSAPVTNLNTIKAAMFDAKSVFPQASDFKEVKYAVTGDEFTKAIPSAINYTPNMEVFEIVLSWFSAKAVQPLWLSGPTGSGKTEMMLYMAHMLNIPVSIISGSLDTRGETLFVRMESKGENGGTSLVPVPTDIIKRYRDGGLILIDEIDKFDSPVQSALHPLCDYKELYVEGIGLIKPHRFTKIVATANTVGDGGSMHYTNSVVVDAALRSRFCYLELGYPAPKLEFDILTNHYPDMHGELLKQLINVAGKIRASFENGAVGLPVSTRTLVGWCHSIKMFRAKPLKDSFGFVYANSLPQDERQAAFDTLHACMGDDVELPMPDLIKKL